MSDTPPVYFTDTIQELGSFVHSSALDHDGAGIRAAVEKDMRQTAAEVAQGLGWAAHGAFITWEPATGGENARVRIVEVPVYTEIRRNTPQPYNQFKASLPPGTVITELPLRPMIVDGQQMNGSVHNGVLLLEESTDPE